MVQGKGSSGRKGTHAHTHTEGVSASQTNWKKLTKIGKIHAVKDEEKWQTWYKMNTYDMDTTPI